jgi:hypothetical protein
MSPATTDELQRVNHRLHAVEGYVNKDKHKTELQTLDKEKDYST